MPNLNLKTIAKRPIVKPTYKKSKEEWKQRFRRQTDETILKQVDPLALFDPKTKLPLYGEEHVHAILELAEEIEARRAAQAFVDVGDAEDGADAEEVPKSGQSEEEGHYEFVNTGKGGVERFWITAKSMN